ncbi:MAG: glucose-6-phosphate isomerase [Planctomycetota bacterium]
MPEFTINIDSSNALTKAVGDHGLNADDVEHLDAKARGFRSRIVQEIANGQHAYLRLPHKPDVASRVQQLADSRRGSFKHLVILGIGGSALGTRTLHQALESATDLHVIDNTDPALIRATDSAIDLRETLFIAVSKSGGTLETVAALGYFVGRIRDARLNLADHLIAITDPEHGHLRAFAEQHGLDTLEIPADVGGRFSVLTQAGLLPAALCGIDIAKLLRGAARTSEIEPENPFVRLGLLAVQMCRDYGKSGFVFMPYSSRLGFLADWFVQLWDESLGKKHATDGSVVNAGQTAIRAVGATDQHSSQQLFLEGPNDKLVVFVRVEDHGENVPVGGFEWGEFNVGFMQGKNFGEIINAQQAGTAQALTSQHRPNVTMTLPKLDASTLGELLMGLQVATTCAGLSFGVNPYDQPAVELGKNISKDMLGG